MFNGHIIIDDMGTEKSDWSRTSTITVLANLVHTHYAKKVTQSYVIEVDGFMGSAALNIQPVLFADLLASSDWVPIVTGKQIG